MDIDLIFKITVSASLWILNQLLVRSGREEQALMVTLAALIIVMMVMVQQISDLFALTKACSICNGWSCFVTLLATVSWERYLPCCSGRKSRFGHFVIFALVLAAIPLLWEALVRCFPFSTADPLSVCQKSVFAHVESGGNCRCD